MKTNWYSKIQKAGVIQGTRISVAIGVTAGIICNGGNVHV